MVAVRMAEESVDSMVTPEKDELDDGNMSKNSAGSKNSLSNARSTDSRPRRASVGSYHAGHISSRSSADKSESANSSQNVVPRYLRASTGSCHDFCKFGKGHSVETKERKPFRKSIAKPLLAKLSPEQIPVEILVSGGKKKEDALIGGQKKDEAVIGGQKKEEVVSVDEKKPLLAKLSPEQIPVEILVSGGKKKEDAVIGGQKKEDAVIGGQKKEEVVPVEEKKEEDVNHGCPIDTKDHATYQKPSPDIKSYPTKPRTSLGKEKATKHKPLTYTNNHSPIGPSLHNRSNLRKPKLSKTYSSKQNDSSGNKTLLPKGKPSSGKKSPSVDPPEIVESVFFPYTEIEDSVKQGSPTDDKLSRTESKATSVVKQQSSPVKLKPVKVKPSSASDDTDGVHGKGRKSSHAQTGRKLMTTKVSAKKILAPPSATLPSKLSLKKTAQTNTGKPGLKLVSPLKDRSRMRRVNNKASNGEKVTEKTFNVIGVETETGNNVSESIPGDNVISSPQSPLSAKSSSHRKSLSSSSSHEEEDNSDSEECAVEVDRLISMNSLGTGKETPVKETHKKTMRKHRVVVPEDVSPVKVKFRMGKVVELQADNNLPRRLRFRRARMLGVEESKGDLRRKASKKAAVNSDTAGMGGVSSHQKVVLKHQNVQQGKKDAQGLLNNVIEETASKLAVSRKSKVKALVGAFETVISLQETKPSTQLDT